MGHVVSALLDNARLPSERTHTWRVGIAKSAVSTADKVSAEKHNVIREEDYLICRVVTKGIKADNNHLNKNIQSEMLRTVSDACVGGIDLKYAPPLYFFFVRGRLSDVRVFCSSMRFGELKPPDE